MAEVPTVLSPDGRSRPPHLKTWRDGWRHLKFLLLHSPLWLFVIPGSVLIALGALIASLLFFGPFQFGANVVLDLNSFISACFLLVVGTQLLTFGAVARNSRDRDRCVCPRSRRSELLFEHVSTDRLALLSAIFALIGIGMFGYAVRASGSAELRRSDEPAHSPNGHCRHERPRHRVADFLLCISSWSSEHSRQTFGGVTRSCGVMLRHAVQDG